MPDNSANNKRIAKNTLFLTIRSVIVMLVYLYTSRVILNTLGVEDYGVYSVIGGFVSMFGFLNTSLAAGVQRFYNYEHGANGENAMTSVYNAALRIQFILVAIIFILLETIGLWYLYNKMVLPEGRIDVAFWLFQFSMVSMVITIMQTPYTAAIMSFEKMDFFALVSIIDVFVNLGLTIALPFIPADKLLMYGILTLLRIALMFLLNFIFCKKNFKVIHFERKVDTSLLKKMLGFSGWNVFGTFGGVAKDQGLNMILNLFFGPVVNAARGVAMQVSGAVSGLVANVSVSVRPQLTGSYAKGDKRRAFNLMYSLSKISFTALYMMSLPIMIDIDYILHLWLGDAVPEHTNTFVILVFLMSYISTFNAAFSAIIHSSGKMKVYQLVGASFNIAILPIVYIFLKLDCSAEMAILISVIVFAIAQIPDLFILRHQEQMSIREYLKKVALPLILVVITSVFVPFIPSLFMREGFLRLAVIAIVSVVSVGASFYFLGTDTTEKALVRAAANKMLNKFIQR